MIVQTNNSLLEKLPWSIISFNIELQVINSNAAARTLLKHAAVDKPVTLHDITWIDQSGEPLYSENHPVVQCFANGEKASGIIIGFSADNQVVWIEAHCIPEFGEGNVKPVRVVFTFTQTATPRGAKTSVFSDETKVITVRDYKCIFESDILSRIGLAVIVADAQGNITYTNDAACTMFGWSKEEFSKKNVLDTTVPDQSNALASAIMEKLAKGESWSGELEVKRKDGTIFPAFITDTPLSGELGELTGIISVSSDISERKMLEEKQHIHEMLASTHEDLIKSNNQLSAVFNNVKDAIVVQDNEGKIVFTNRSYDEIFINKIGTVENLSLDDFKNDFLLADFNGNVVSTDKWPIARVLRGESVKGERYKVTDKKHGHSWYFEYAGGPVYDPGGQQIFSILSVSDITRQEESNHKLIENEKSYRSLFETNPEPMWIFDVETLRFLEVNHAAVEHYGYSREEFLNMTLKDIRPEEDVPKLVDYIQGSDKVLNHSDRWRHKKKNGEVIDVEILSHTIDYQGRKAKHILANDVTERQKALKELEISEIRFQELFDTMPNGYYRSTPEGYFVDANPAYIRMLGYDSLEELKSLYIPEDIYVSPDERDEISTENPEYINEIETYRLRKKNGDIVWIEDNARCIRDEKGNTKYYEGICRDITDRKLAEDKLREREEKYRTLFSSMDQGFCIIEKIASADDRPIDFRYIEANPAFEHHTGLVDVVGKTIRQVVPDAEQAIFEIYENVVKTGKHHKFETFVASLDFWIEAEVLPTEISGQIAVLFSNISDRKQAEESMHQREMLLREMGRIARIGGWELDCKTMKQVWTDETFAIHDREKGIYDPNSTEELSRFEPGSNELIKKAFEEAITQGKPYDLEVEMTTVKGNRKWVRAVCYPVLTDGKVTKLTGTVQDITERKHNEEIVRIALAKYKSLFDNFPMGITVSDKNGNIIETNTTAEKLLGISAEEQKQRLLSGEEWQIIRTDGTPMLAEEYASVRSLRAGQKVENVEMGIVKPDKSVIWINVTAAPIPLEGYGVVVTYNDITERTQKDEQLAKLAERLNLATHSAGIGIWDWDIRNNELVWDVQMVALYGLQPGEFKSANDAWMNGVHPEDREAVNLHIQNTLLGENIYDSEFRVIWPDGSIHWLKSDAQVFRDEKGAAIRMVGVNYDITERKQAEEKLRENEMLLRQVLDSEPDAIFAVDLNYRLLINNRQHQHILVESGGHQLQAGETILPAEYPAEVLNYWREHYNQAFNGEEFKREMEWLYSDEKIHIMDTNFSPLRNTSGEIMGALVVIHDITERKQAEQKLRESERKLKLFVEFAPAAIAMFDNDMRYIAASKRFLLNYGIQDSNIIGRSHYEIFPEIGEEWKDVHRRCLAGATEINEEDSFLRTDGSIDWVRWEIHPWYHDDEKIGGIILFSELISERKKAEEQLRASEAKFKAVFDNAPVGISLLDNQRNLLESNNMLAHIVQMDEATLAAGGYRSRRYIREDGSELPVDELASTRAITEQRPIRNVVNGIVLENGETIWTQVSAAPLGTNDPRYVVITQDITERKQALDALRENERRLRKTIETTSDGFWIVDPTLRFIEVNEAYCNMSGYSREELMTMTVSDVEAIETTDITNEHIQKIFHKGGDRFETVHWRKNGSLFVVEVSVNVLDPDQNLLICFCRDITERKEAEKQIRESEKRFATIFEDSPVGIAISRLRDGKIIMVNSSIVLLLGYTPEELVGQSTSQLGIWVNPDDRQSFVEILSNDLRVEGMEATLKLKSGDSCQVMMWGELIELAGEPCMMAEVIDINERKKAERQLREREAELNEAQVLAKMASWRIDLTNYQLTVSENYRNLFGVDDETVELTHDYFVSRVHPDDVHLMDLQQYQFTPESAPFNKDYRILMPDGSIKWFQNSMVGEFIEGKLVALKGSNIDITDKKNQEQEIRLQNQKLNAILNALPDKLFIHDAEGNFLEAYTTDPSGFIVPMEKFIGKNLRDIFPAEVAGLNLKYLNEARGNNQIITHEFSVDYKGRFSHFEVRVVPFMEDKVIRFVRDITEKKNQEEEIRSQNQKLNAILNALPDRLFVHDSEGNYLEAYTTDPSGFIAKMDNFIGKNITDVLPKDVAETNLKYLQECLEKKKIILHELSFDYMGTYSHFEVRVVPLMKDKVIRFVRDITERKEIEKQINKLNKAIEQSPVAIVVTDSNAAITYVSPAFTAITGYRKEEIIGENPRILNSGKNPAKIYKDLWRNITSGKIWEGELINKKKDGTFYWEQLSITPLFEKENQVTGYLAVKQDITEKKKNEQEILELNTNLERKVEERTLELKRINEELIKTKEAAEEANKAKSIFLANMSHEIRTPLNSIIGFSELLFNSSIDEKKRSQVVSIRNSGRSLLNIINDILDLSKVEAGKIVIEREPLNVFKIVSDVGNMFEQKAAEKKLSLTIESVTDLITPLLLDETRLRQILFNLVGNAIKFTHKGGISVVISHEEKEDDTINLKISVADTGIGIPEDQLEAIFEPFVQQQGQVQKTFGGTGLGLAISRRMAEAMGGEIRVKSAPNEGSEFTIYLKNVAKATAHPEEQENTPAIYSSVSFKGNIILIVDDITDNRKLLRDVLEPTGARLYEAENGAQAVRMALALKPDIILMDIRMPVMDGLEACRILKSTPETAKIPCIAVSASIKLGKPGKEIPENFEENLMKPVVFEHLFEVLLRYLKHAVPTDTGHSGESSAIWEAEQNWTDDLKQFAMSELVPLYQHVMRTQLVDEMEDFGKKLVVAGQRFNEEMLVSIGRKIGDYADQFEVDKLTQTMKQFQLVLDHKLN